MFLELTGIFLTTPYLDSLFIDVDGKVKDHTLKAVS